MALQVTRMEILTRVEGRYKHAQHIRSGVKCHVLAHKYGQVMELKAAEVTVINLKENGKYTIVQDTGGYHRTQQKVPSSDSS